MSEQEHGRTRKIFRSILTTCLVVTGSFFLASCGGGGDETSSSAMTAEDGTKQALGTSSTAAAVPGGWKGRAPKYEVINGITVPPEPAPSINNATLAGVDVNGNGVRDDVERGIARASSNPQQFSKVMMLAKAYQIVLSAPTPSTRLEGLLIERIILCSTDSNYTSPPTLVETSDTSLESQIFNTDQRKDKFYALRAVVGGYDSTEVNCD